MIKWLEVFVKDSLNKGENVVIVPSSSINPEESYYYQPHHQFKGENWEEHLSFDKHENRKPTNKGCRKITLKELGSKLNKFSPLQESAKKMNRMLQETYGIKQVVAFEVDHC
jgi:hypothetical protein